MFFLNNVRIISVRTHTCVRITSVCARWKTKVWPFRQSSIHEQDKSQVVEFPFGCLDERDICNYSFHTKHLTTIKKKYLLGSSFI